MVNSMVKRPYNYIVQRTKRNPRIDVSKSQQDGCKNWDNGGSDDIGQPLELNEAHWYGNKRQSENSLRDVVARVYDIEFLDGVMH